MCSVSSVLMLSRCQVLMEEFSALGASCEVDGGQLRYHTFVWLEKEANMLRLFSEHSRPTDVAAMCEDAYPAEDILFAVGACTESTLFTLFLCTVAHIQKAVLSCR